MSRSAKQFRRFTESLVRHFQLARSDTCRCCGAVPGAEHTTGCVGADSGGFIARNVAEALKRLANRAEAEGDFKTEWGARRLRNQWLQVEPPLLLQ